MRYNCPHCQQQFKIPDNSEGKKFRCPKCNKVFVLQTPIVGIPLEVEDQTVSQNAQDGRIAETSEPAATVPAIGSPPINRLRVTASPPVNSVMARLELVVTEAGMAFSRQGDSVLMVTFDLGSGRSDSVVLAIAEAQMPDGRHAVGFTSTPCGQFDDETDFPASVYKFLLKMITYMYFGAFCLCNEGLFIKATAIFESMRPEDCRQICEEIVRRRDEFRNGVNRVLDDNVNNISPD